MALKKSYVNFIPWIYVQNWQRILVRGIFFPLFLFFLCVMCFVELKCGFNHKIVKLNNNKQIQQKDKVHESPMRWGKRKLGFGNKMSDESHILKQHCPIIWLTEILLDSVCFTVLFCVLRKFASNFSSSKLMKERLIRM